MWSPTKYAYIVTKAGDFGTSLCVENMCMNDATQNMNSKKCEAEE